MRAHRRFGYTLAEILVVTAIIGVLIGILLPAVQKARDAAARTKCANNLHQLVIAAHQYHDNSRSLPAGMRYQNGKDSFQLMSWLTQLLPYLERQDLWSSAVDSYKSSPNPIEPSPHADLSTVVNAFVCPSDPRALDVQIAQRQQIPVALTCYLGVEGRDLDSLDGVLFVDSSVRMTDIRDGTSCTLLAGERPASADYQFGWWYAGAGQGFTGSADMVLGVEEQDIVPYSSVPCLPGVYKYGPGAVTNQCDMFHFWSLHTGGANFAFADGSVRFLSYSAAPLMPALASRAGGEAVEAP
jgi:prepilin-type processing-associated H-X9-DG protein/prepilin-type N-terminal cleavage/methylation domain-containing protein